MDFNKLIIGRHSSYVFDRIADQPEHKAYCFGIVNNNNHITYLNYLNKSNIDNCHKQHDYQHQVSNEYQLDMDNQLNPETNNLFPCRLSLSLVLVDRGRNLKGDCKMKKSRRDQIIEILLERGYKEVESRSRKYRQFTKDENKKYIFVGRRGAVRYGKTVTGSVNIAYQFERFNNIS